jgi:hypothetical protein
VGYVGENCDECNDMGGYQPGVGNDQCVPKPEPSPSPTVWPNEFSKANSDWWLVKHHFEIQQLRPKVLVINFANPTRGTTMAEDLVQRIVNGFRDGSRPRGNISAPPRWQFEIAKFVNLRDGEGGRPLPPPDYPFENSQLFPRTPAGFDYKQLFINQTITNLYGYDGRNLCALVNDGVINELWVVGSGDVLTDAGLFEILENKQRYDANNRPILGSFDRCAANGCFADDVPWCGRSFKVSFVNYNRGPGCFIHSYGHGMETAGQSIPLWRKWWLAFVGFDWDVRYSLPFYTAYGISCIGPDLPCKESRNETTVRFFHNGALITRYNFDAVCGNVHFPPNGGQHYDYFNTTTVLSSCLMFGFGGELRRLNSHQWMAYGFPPFEYTDCGGEFLVWWLQRMPWYGSGQRFSDGTLMAPVGPFLYY